MWNCNTTPLDSRTHHYSFPHTYAQVVELWHDDSSFRSFFTNLLADSPFAAFRWETPPITTSTTSRTFEFVLIDSPSLIRPPDADAFAAHFPGDPNPSVAARSEERRVGKECRCRWG